MFRRQTPARDPSGIEVKLELVLDTFSRSEDRFILHRIARCERGGEDLGRLFPDQIRLVTARASISECLIDDKIAALCVLHKEHHIGQRIEECFGDGMIDGEVG